MTNRMGGAGGGAFEDTDDDGVAELTESHTDYQGGDARNVGKMDASEIVDGAGVNHTGELADLSEVDRSEPGLTHIASLSDANLGRPHDIVTTGVGTALTSGKDGNVCLIDLYPRKNPKVVAFNTGFTDAQLSANYPYRDPRYAFLVGDNSNLTYVTGLHRAVNAHGSAALTGTEVNGADWYHANGNSHLFIAEKSGYVEAVDVSTIGTAPTITGSYTATIDSPHDVALFDDHAVTVNQADGATPKIETINFISVTDGAVKSNPLQGGTGITDSQLNGANRIEILTAPYAVVANNYAGTVATVDLTEVTAPTVADVASTGAIDGPSGMAVAGDYCITTSRDRVTVWDVSDPENIDLTDQYIFDNKNISGHDVAVEGRYLYVPGQATNTIEVFDFGTELGLHTNAMNATSGEA